MRRHVTWILLLLAVPVSYFAIAAIIAVMAEAAKGAGDSGNVGWLLLLQMALLLAVVVVPIVLLLCAIVAMKRTYRRGRRASGKFNKYEQQILTRAQYAADAWEVARNSRAALLTQRMPPTIQQWDVVPYPGEQFFARLTLTYARYYGANVSYNQSSMFALGSPAFVIGALAVTALSNAAARAKAAAQSAPQWREWQTSMVYVSNQRLVVNADGHWLSFEYGAMTAVFPEVSSNTLICQFSGVEPMLLSGDEAAIAAVFTVMQTHGVEALRGHPSLQALDHPAPAPSLPPVGRRG